MIAGDGFADFIHSWRKRNKNRVTRPKKKEGKRACLPSATELPEGSKQRAISRPISHKHSYQTGFRLSVRVNFGVLRLVTALQKIHFLIPHMQMKPDLNLFLQGSLVKPYQVRECAAVRCPRRDKCKQESRRTITSSKSPARLPFGARAGVVSGVPVSYRATECARCGLQNRRRAIHRRIDSCLHSSLARVMS